MKNNPIIPYILIMAFGIGLIFFMSLEGAGNKEEIAKSGEETTAGETAKAEGSDDSQIVSKCIACHGQDLKGGMGPNLHGFTTDKAHVKDVVMNGFKTMPAGTVTDEKEAEAIAEYVTSLKK